MNNCLTQLVVVCMSSRYIRCEVMVNCHGLCMLGARVSMLLFKVGALVAGSR